MIEFFLYKRLRRAPYTEFRRVSTSLDDFSSTCSSPVFMIKNVPMMDLEMKGKELETAKKLFNFVFFKGENILNKLVKNSESIGGGTHIRKEREVVRPDRNVQAQQSLR